MTKHSLVCFSGGLDSTVLLYKLLSEGKQDICLLYFDYGQEWSYESVVVQRWARTVDVPILTCQIGHLLTGVEGYIPMRNPLLMSYALNLACTEGADKVFLGLTWDAVFPDCSPEFLDRYNFMLQAALEEPVYVEAPLMALDKREIITLGGELGVDFRWTWSCFQNPKEGKKASCGECPKCENRSEIFKVVGYESDPAADILAEYGETSGFAVKIQ